MDNTEQSQFSSCYIDKTASANGVTGSDADGLGVGGGWSVFPHRLPRGALDPQGLAPRDPGLGVGGGAAGGDGVGGLHSGGRERSRTFRPIPAPYLVRLALCNQVDHSVGRNRVKLCVGEGSGERRGGKRW
uniref:Uncharacterized protein n=1 Tax=Pipistrellus kuhlii TaxID=59472 RepID=A0A7J7XB46_PIPKU|nr:hypothetical protein mPipKuh1_010657 [Pipistrellus kuhlii]